MADSLSQCISFFSFIHSFNSKKNTRRFSSVQFNLVLESIHGWLCVYCIVFIVFCFISYTKHEHTKLNGNFNDNNKPWPLLVVVVVVVSHGVFFLVLCFHILLLLLRQPPYFFLYLPPVVVATAVAAASETAAVVESALKKIMWL